MINCDQHFIQICYTIKLLEAVDNVFVQIIHTRGLQLISQRLWQILQISNATPERFGE